MLADGLHIPTNQYVDLLKRIRKVKEKENTNLIVYIFSVALVLHDIEAKYILNIAVRKK
jgi:hypothetical protein